MNMFVKKEMVHAAVHPIKIRFSYAKCQNLVMNCKDLRTNYEKMELIAVFDIKVSIDLLAETPVEAFGAVPLGHRIGV